MMLEPWDEILTLEKERQLCADEVAAIKTACAADHGKRHVSECSECWSRVLNRMRDRYLNSATKEWFSGRRLFLQDLDTLFTQAHEKKTDLKTIEQRISDEKREWFRDRVRNLGLQYATKTPNEAKALHDKLNDRSVPATQLASELRGILNDDPLLSDATFDHFLDRLRVAKSSDARREICIELFFQPGQNAENDAKYQKYIDMVRCGTWVFEVVNIMIRDRQVAKANQDQKQALQKKLEELRRARAAHEVDKTKKAKIRQDKANAAAESEDSLPPCAVCAKTVDPEDFHTCPICFVLAELFELQKEPLVFCSQDCKEQGYNAHAKDAHSCSSGQDCADIQDEDVDMDGEGHLALFCQECVGSLKVPSLFCSPRCFDVNFQRHREQVHVPERTKRNADVDDEKMLEFSSEDRSAYRARKIEDHFITLDDAVGEYQERTGAAEL